MADKKKRTSVLAPYKREIVRARANGDSLMIIGKRYGVSREYVRQFLEKQGAGNNVPKPYYLSVATKDEVRFFGCHATEDAAIEHFYNNVPLNPEIIAYSVYRKGVRKDRRLWSNVIAKDGKYLRIGTAVYGFQNLEAQRKLVMERPLERSAEKLAELLGDNEELRISLRKCNVKFKGDNTFEIHVPEEPKELSEKEAREKVIADLLK